MKNQYIAFLRDHYPALNSEPLESLISENLLSSHRLRLPRKVLQQGHEIVESFYRLRSHPAYMDSLQDQIRLKNLKDPGNKAIMMSYDFHLDENGNLRLIEINTNAAFLVLGHLFYQMQEIRPPVENFQLQDLRTCIETELSLSGISVSNPRIAIVDEAPQDQRLYVEFLVAKEMIKSWTWPCEIRDLEAALLDPRPQFIYNRYTDFYLTREKSQGLRKAYEDGTCCLSPNPFEYFLLADKERMTEWSTGSLKNFPELKSEASLIESTVLGGAVLTPNNREEIWARRKGLFFKPTQDHGSKGSFKGASISRKVFEELVEKRALAQEYMPAAEVTAETTSGPQNFRYDLRFYAYQGTVQTVMARLYQGQTTNLRTPGGGFACVIFED